MCYEGRTSSRALDSVGVGCDRALSRSQSRSAQTRHKLPLVAQARHPGLISRSPYKAGSREVLQAIGPVGRTHYLVRRIGDQDKAEFLVPFCRLEDYVFFADAETARKYRF